MRDGMRPGACHPLAHSALALNARQLKPQLMSTLRSLRHGFACSFCAPRLPLPFLRSSAFPSNFRPTPCTLH